MFTSRSFPSTYIFLDDCNIYNLHFFIQQCFVTISPCHCTNFSFTNDSNVLYFWAISDAKDRVGFVVNLYVSLGEAHKPLES